MGFEIDTNLHWTEHYVEHGFCVIRRAIPEAFCERTIAAIQKALHANMPPSQWNTETIDPERAAGITDSRNTPPEMRTALESIYDQPELIALTEQMYQSDNAWNGSRMAVCFLKLKNISAEQTSEPELAPYGHVDFVNRHIPMFGDGFTCQVSLVKSEPFSGNITIYPGWHKAVQKLLLDDPDYRFTSQSNPGWQAAMPKVEPYEFVADPGDVLFFHHLVGHAGNANQSTSGMPRLAIHFHMMGNVWPNGVDPDQPDMSPWLRSHAHNGRIDLPYSDHEMTVTSHEQRVSAHKKGRLD